MAYVDLAYELQEICWLYGWSLVKLLCHQVEKEKETLQVDSAVNLTMKKHIE